MIGQEQEQEQQHPVLEHTEVDLALKKLHRRDKKGPRRLALQGFSKITL